MTLLSKYWPWLLGVVVVCAACFGAWWYYDHRVYAGVVQSKTFVPAHTTTSVYYIKVGDIMVPQTQTIHYPDRWSVDIEGVDKHGRDGVSTWDVSQSRYDSLSIGAYISFGEEE